MKLKEFQLDVEALLSQVVNGHGFLHYGYWENEEADEFTLARMGRAQKDYFDRLVRSLPEGTRSILDVGSGTGSNAAALIEAGFDVRCVCPSARLNVIAREKLPAGTPIYETGFEGLDLPDTFDSLLFAESFHYIKTAKALENIGRYAKRGALIFDYFPKPGVNAPAWRIRHADFVQSVQQTLGNDFKITEDVDLTAKIMPTFVVLDHLKNRYVHPFVRNALQSYSQEHPILAFVLRRFLNKALQRTLRVSRRAETFQSTYEYRLIRIERA